MLDHTNYLSPALGADLAERTTPDKPTSESQKHKKTGRCGTPMGCPSGVQDGAPVLRRACGGLAEGDEVQRLSGQFWDTRPGESYE